MVPVRGFLHVFEVVFAVTMMVLLTTAIYPPAMQSNRIEPYRHVGFQALEYLDGVFLLRQNAVSGNAAGIEQDLNSLFPPEVGYAVEICDFSGSCTGSNLPDSNTVVGAYYVAGNGTYSPREVKVFVWLK